MLKNILNLSCISFGHFCVWFTQYLEYLLILHCWALLFTSFRSSQSSWLLPRRHTPFHVTDLYLVFRLSFLERSFLLFHKTAVLRWWSLLLLLIPLHSHRVKEETWQQLFFSSFILNYVVDFAYLKIIIQEKTL